MQHPFLALVLAGLAMIGPFSIDTYLPAFPAMAGAFRCDLADLQLSLSVYLFAFSLVMPWQGPLSDAYGRRRIILWGLIIYIAGSLVCIFSTSIYQLLIGRILQGSAAGVGTVVNRAIIRDLHDGASAQKMMAKVSLIYAISPVVAPLLGGVLEKFFPWQSVFIFLVAFGVVLLASSYFFIGETLPESKRVPFSLSVLCKDYATLCSSTGFIGTCLTLSLTFCGMFIYVLSAPVFLIEHLRLTPQEFYVLFLPIVIGMMVGSFISGRLAGRINPRQSVFTGLSISMISALTNTFLNLQNQPLSVTIAVTPILFFTLGLGIAMPGLQLLALDFLPAKRGLASGLLGFFQAGTNGLAAILIAPFAWTTPLTLSICMLCFVSLGALAFFSSLMFSKASQD